MASYFEDVGYDDETGADYVGDDDDVGADYVGARRKKKMNLAKMALAGRLPQIFLGFDSTVAAATAATSTAEPNVHLRPTDLVVRAANVEDWLITDIQVGRVNMIAGANGISASAFSPLARRSVISCPPLQAGTNAQLAITNLTAASSRFLAHMVCGDISRHPASP